VSSEIELIKEFDLDMDRTKEIAITGGKKNL